jgi:hypothetical protein
MLFSGKLLINQNCPFVYILAFPAIITGKAPKSSFESRAEKEHAHGKPVKASYITFSESMARLSTEQVDTEKAAFLGAILAAHIKNAGK